MVNVKVSNKFSLFGFDVKYWLNQQKSTIKLVLGAIISFGVANPDSIILTIPSGIIVIVSRAFLDIVDFYVSEVELN